MKVLRKTTERNAGIMDSIEEKLRILKAMEQPLVCWFASNQRIMPWRQKPTPYHVWVSEIMLQQTRVETVIPYYERFIRSFPDVKALSEAPEDLLLKNWEGLGYYVRARNLQKAAKLVMSLYGGELPDRYETLLTLPGIGTYTAGAIMSIACHKRYPVADGNVLRVLARLFSDDADISLPETKRNDETLLKQFLNETETDPSLFNQALMEIGALVCIPNGEPKCAVCPLAPFCRGRIEGRLSLLPVKAPKKSRKKEKLTVLIPEHNGRLALVKRTESGLLSGLYGFISLPGHLSPEAVGEWLSGQGFLTDRIDPLPEKKHVFTHVEWQMAAYRVSVLNEPEGFVYAASDELSEKYALPSAFKKWDL